MKTKYPQRRGINANIWPRAASAFTRGEGRIVSWGVTERRGISDTKWRRSHKMATLCHARLNRNNTDAQGQTAVTAYLKNNQLLVFAFV